MLHAPGSLTYTLRSSRSTNHNYKKAFQKLNGSCISSIVETSNIPCGYTTSPRMTMVSFLFPISHSSTIDARIVSTAVRSRMLDNPKLMISLFQFLEDKKDIVRNYCLLDVVGAFIHHSKRFPDKFQSTEHPDDEVYLADFPADETTTPS